MTLLALLAGCAGGTPTNDKPDTGRDTEPVDDTAPPVDTADSAADTDTGHDSAPDTSRDTGGDTGAPDAPSRRILLFVAYEDVWWGEYKVLYEGLRAAGWEVDVRSAGTGVARSYQSDGTIASSANSLFGSSYTDFVESFEARFGVAWDPTWDTAADIPLDGVLTDVTTMEDHAALVVVGGVGAVRYRLDGSYGADGSAGHEADAATVQATAERLDRLAGDALSRGRPVLAACHGATLAAFFRVPDTAGEGADGLGRSVLEGRTATGYPLADGDTEAAYTAQGVTYLADRPLVIDGPPADSMGSWGGVSRVITGRDWYPQTVAHAAATLDNVLQTYPSELDRSRRVLVVHGGPVDTSNCGADNRATNDIPCNYGVSPTEVIPADHTHLEALLDADAASDPYSLSVTGLDLLGGSLPFDIDDEAAIRTWIADYDTIVFFKHWSTGVTDALQRALLDHADDGGGLIAIHHGLYDDAHGKSLLVAAFGASSAPETWGARAPDTGPYALLDVNHGHFVSSYAVPYAAYAERLPAGFPVSIPNPSGSSFPTAWITDEIYTNTAFDGSVSFGTGVGEVNVLLGNDHADSWPAQGPTSGFTRRYDPSGDGTEGRLVYLQPGERTENYVVGSAVGQMIRNAVVWAGG
jgi:putative intracellular protease/amidase